MEMPRIVLGMFMVAVLGRILKELAEEKKVKENWALGQLFRGALEISNNFFENRFAECHWESVI